MGFEPTRAHAQRLSRPLESLQIENTPTIQLQITKEDVEDYLETKGSDWSPKHYRDEKWILEQFLRITNGIVTFDTVKQYIKEISCYAKRRSYANSVCRFLEFIRKKKNFDVTPFIELLKEIKPPKKEKALFAEPEEEVFTLTLEDIQESIKIIANNCKPVTALRAISLIVFMATTGVRPEEACSKKVSGIYTPGIQKRHIDLSKDYIILPAEISKTGYKRVLPIHPQLKPLLEKLLKDWPKEDLWNYDTLQKIIQKTPIKQMKRLRKFFVKHSAKIGFPELYRIAIAGHDEEELVKLKVTPEFYSKFTPQEIVNVYMEYWGKVEILPPDIDI